MIHLRSCALLLACCGTALAGPAADIVKQPLPGFPVAPFKVYSGFLNVTASVAGYDGFVIHYQFHESQSNPATDPVVAWHTGGPGGSSIYGQWAETGYFQISESGQAVNSFAWNRVANTLFLESPAGAFLTPAAQHSGFSYCLKGGVRQLRCSWNDKTQAEAYLHTLRAFYAAFPEHAAAELYLVGESYAGQYIPNIATRLLQPDAADVGDHLKGIAVGNGCWGGGENNVMCNGPNSDRDLVRMYYGKGLISEALNTEVQDACSFPDLPFDSVKPAALGLKCQLELTKVDAAVGPHNVYNVYDNCAGSTAWYKASGKSPRWLSAFLHEHAHNATALASLHALGAGYDWTCGTFTALPAYFARADVRAALNLPQKSLSSYFSYDSSGPASITLYPELIKKIRVLIYNGDADSCVPYVGNEEWTTGLAARDHIVEAKAWHPWYAENTSTPAGYATSYHVANMTAHDPTFAFVTVRLSGHEVPHYTPGAAFSMFSRFLTGGKW